MYFREACNKMKPPLQRIEDFIECLWDDADTGVTNENVIKLEAALKEAVKAVSNEALNCLECRIVLDSIADILDGGEE